MSGQQTATRSREKLRRSEVAGKKGGKKEPSGKGEAGRKEIDSEGIPKKIGNENGSGNLWNKMAKRQRIFLILPVKGGAFR